MRKSQTRHRAGRTAEGPAQGPTHRGASPWSRPGAELWGMVINSPAAAVLAVAFIIALFSAES